MTVSDFFEREGDYPDFDAAAAAQRLSAAIRCRTISGSGDEEFQRLHELMRSCYPAVMREGSFETINNSVLITLPGSDDTLRPALFMSHQDVVPIAPGTESDWRYPPFSGELAEGCIWGRGSLDIKQQVFGTLEAAEYLLQRGERFKRTVYLAFGEDEETENLGAMRIAESLRERGVTLEFVLDEGGGKIESGEPYGADGVFICQIDLAEKGYADLELTVESAGGHSSRPFGGTSLGRLSQAISRIVEAPFERRLNTLATAALEKLRTDITAEPLRSLVADIEGNSAEIAEYFMTRRELFPLVTTTAAPTIIEGGSSACNVMPQNMRAVINFRLAPGDTPEAVMEHCRAAVNDESVRLRFLQANEPSGVSRSDCFGYAAVEAAMGRYYPAVRFIPCMTVGGTDARRYEIICDACLRCSPFMTDDSDSVHGTNERLSLRAYAQGIRVLISLMHDACL